MTYFRKAGGNMVKVGIALLPGLVADAPKDHGRMVAVTVDHGFKVLLGPVVEQEGVAVGLLRDGPGVRQLVHHDESHAVAEVEQFGGRGIVGGADGVAAHFLEHLEASLPCRVVPDCSEGSGVVVETHSLEECLDSVNVYPVIFVFDIPQSEDGDVGVRRVSRSPSPAASILASLRLSTA